MSIFHKLSHLLGWNGCYVDDLPDGHWAVCSGCGEKRIRITSRTPEEYEFQQSLYREQDQNQMRDTLQMAVQHGVEYNGTPSERYNAACRMIDNAEYCFKALDWPLTQADIDQAHDMAVRRIAGV